MTKSMFKVLDYNPYADEKESRAVGSYQYSLHYAYEKGKQDQLRDTLRQVVEMLELDKATRHEELVKCQIES